MLLLDVARVLWSPESVKFLCKGHSYAKLSIDYTGKVCATIKGYDVGYFFVAEKNLAKTTSGIDNTVSSVWYGSKVSAEAV